MTKARSRLFTHALGLVLTGSLLVTGPAHAQPDSASQPGPAGQGGARREPTAGDLATARAALREGLVLRDKGDLPGALLRLTSAFDLVPTPVTGFELGKTHMMQGRVLQAHELFKKVVRMAPSMEESARSQTSRDEAARLAKELEPRIPSLRLKLTLPHGATAVLKVDDEAVAKPGPETLRAVDPGPHDISAKAGDGPEQKVHVEIAEAETKDVALAPQWIAPKVTAAEGKPAGQIIYVRQTNPLAFIGFGFAAAGLVVVGVASFVFIDAADEASDRCGRSFCPPSTNRIGLPQNAVVDADFDSVSTRYEGARIAIVAGAITAVVFGVVGGIAAARPLKEKIVSSIRPVVGPTGGGVVGTF